MNSEVRASAIIIVLIMLITPAAAGHAMSYEGRFSNADNNQTSVYFTSGFYISGQQDCAQVLSESIDCVEVTENGKKYRKITGTHNLSPSNLELRMSRIQCPDPIYVLEVSKAEVMVDGVAIQSSSIMLENAFGDNVWKGLNDAGSWYLGDISASNPVVFADSILASITLTIPSGSEIRIGENGGLSIFLDIIVQTYLNGNAIEGNYREHASLTLNLDIVTQMQNVNNNVIEPGYSIGPIPVLPDGTLGRPVDYGAHPAVNIRNDENPNGGIAGKNRKVDVEFTVIDRPFIFAVTYSKDGSSKYCELEFEIEYEDSTGHETEYEGCVQFNGTTIFIYHQGGSVTSSTEMPVNLENWFRAGNGDSIFIEIENENHKPDRYLMIDIIFYR